MTSAQQPVETIQAPPSDSTLNQKVAEALVAATSIYAAAKAIELLLRPFRVTVDAIMPVLQRVEHGTAHKPRALFKADGINRAKPGAEIVRATANEDLYFRAAYIVKASRRVQKGLNAGKQLPAILSGENVYYRKHELARTQRAKAGRRAAVAAQLYGNVLGWYLNPRLNNEIECITAAGNNFKADSVPKIGLPGLVHMNCFPAGTLVGGPPRNAAMLRWYDGDLIEIRTERGNVLAGTPNHPVLTEQGWVTFDALHVGSHVVADRRSQGLTSVDPHDDQQPAAIENVAYALGVSRSMATTSMMIAAEDFHGDGRSGEIEVVLPERFLRRESEIFDPLPNNEFVRADDPASLLASLRMFLSMREGVRHTSNRVVSRLRVISFLLRRELVRPKLRSFFDGSNANTVCNEPRGEWGSSDAFASGQFGEALSREVVLDQIVGIRRLPFSGHVYNLSTTDGWYTANGIVAHNCGCYAGPPFAAGGWVDDAIDSLVNRGKLRLVRRKAS